VSPLALSGHFEARSREGKRKGTEGTGIGKKGMGKNTSKINVWLWPCIRYRTNKITSARWTKLLNDKINSLANNILAAVINELHTMLLHNIQLHTSY